MYHLCPDPVTPQAPSQGRTACDFTTATISLGVFFKSHCTCEEDIYLLHSSLFYRSVRYAVFKARHSRTPPDLTTLRGLVFDELERKYSHNKHLRYEESEQVAISWYLRQRKERPLEPLFGK